MNTYGGTVKPENKIETEPIWNMECFQVFETNFDLNDSLISFIVPHSNLVPKRFHPKNHQFTLFIFNFVPSSKQPQRHTS